MAKSYLVIVESPTKAKTIRKFLPKGFEVEASMGHVRDLPQSATDIPAALKSQEWTRLGVNVEKNFEPLYVIPKGKSKIISELKKKLKEADELYLATDEDREGESISWHLLEILKPKVPVKRMVFHEITKTAIERALKETREVDVRLVRAQETRRILDRLVGYTLSPLLWKKIAYGLSAGRVQSVGLRMVVERERERIRFRSATYWDLLAKLSKDGAGFEARLSGVDGMRVATGKDFDELTGKLKNPKEILALSEEIAKGKLSLLKNEKWKVLSVDEKTVNSRPTAPFITSTLQQEANRKLGFSARDAMRVAQALYEEGFITYMRTDSPALSSEAIRAARTCITELYGADYLSEEPRQFISKAKGAQEAHEAIRPAGAQFVHPRETGLSGRELALYELIWKRTVASQMAEATKLSMSVKIQAGTWIFSANGSRILFAGFLRAYVEGSDDPDSALEEREVLLPPLQKGDLLDLKEVEAYSHETKPPARYTEASIVQRLEKEGIGRPSTYASIIDTIIDRGYVRKVVNALVPTFTGFAVIQLLEKYFEELVDFKFTSEMEQALDEIAEGGRESLPYLNQFYLGKKGLLEQVAQKEKSIKPEASRTVLLDQIKGPLIKIGRYGAYLIQEGQNAEVHASIPEDIAPADLTSEQTQDLLLAAAKGPQSMGKHPETGEDLYCLTGRYGPYIQMGLVTEEHPKPRRASLLKGMDPKTLTFDQAVIAISLPRLLGMHPDSKKPVLANQGRFGPYIVHEKDYRSLKKEDDLFSVSLARALELLSEEKKGRRGATLIKELGVHPSDQTPVQVLDGKYGHYIKNKKTNVTLPKEVTIEQLTLAQALELLKSRGKESKRKK